MCWLVSIFEIQKEIFFLVIFLDLVLLILIYIINLIIRDHIELLLFLLYKLFYWSIINNSSLLLWFQSFWLVTLKIYNVSDCLLGWFSFYNLLKKKLIALVFHLIVHQVLIHKLVVCLFIFLRIIFWLHFFIFIIFYGLFICFFLHHLPPRISRLLNVVIKVTLFGLSSRQFINWVMTAIIFFLLISFQNIFPKRLSTWVRDQLIFLIFIIDNILINLFANGGPPVDITNEWRSLALFMWLH